jgi:2,4-dienoyl-CoA reductase-like NADH-dependent reductase (Old Yellow Enzyme family)
MTTYSSHPDGQVCDEEVGYLRARAEGGFDWIVTAACCVHPSGWSFDGQWQASDRRFLSSLRRVADAVREGGSKSILQIHHGGRQAPSRLCGQPVSASAVPSERPNAETPRSLTLAEIEEIVQSFIAAGELAEEAGYDGVEIHGANTYLLQQFVSPHSNRRDDAYGQDRLLFSQRITEGVVKAVGERLLVGYRFSPEEPETPGIRLSHTLGLLDRLLPIGLSYFHVSLRRYDQPSMHDPSSAPILQRLAKHLGNRAPLVASGEVKAWSDVEEALRLGAHSVAVGRMGILNPDWPRRARANLPMRMEVPAEGAEEILSIPSGLARRIYSVPGWFPVEGVAV